MGRMGAEDPADVFLAAPQSGILLPRANSRKGSRGVRAGAARVPAQGAGAGARARDAPPIALRAARRGAEDQEPSRPSPPHPLEGADGQPKRAVCIQTRHKTAGILFVCMQTRAKSQSPAALAGHGTLVKMLGNDLLSHRVTPTVPSALEGLTSVFGKGTGVSPPPWSPNAGDYTGGS